MVLDSNFTNEDLHTKFETLSYSRSR